LEVKVYRVDDLIGDGVNASPYSADADALIDVIVASVAYESWAVNGTGQGEINSFPPGMLVISQTSRVQTEVQNLLDVLRQNKAAVEAETVQQRAEAAKRPISRSISINQSSVAADESKNRVREALLSSVDWNASEAEIDANEKFLLVLDDRILVRHLPIVVAQVKRSVKDLNLEPPRVSTCGFGTTGIAKPASVEPK
jgi:hypothetical protein